MLYVDSVARYYRAGHADNGRNSVVAVHDRGGRRRLALARVGEVLRQKGIKKRVAHADGGPAEPDEGRHRAEFSRREKGRDALRRELLERPPYDLAGCEFLVGRRGAHAADLVQDVLRQPGFRFVLVRDAVHGGDGFGLPPSREEELGGFEEVKEKEAADEH